MLALSISANVAGRLHTAQYITHFGISLLASLKPEPLSPHRSPQSF
jgi:hypothetical protein